MSNMSNKTKISDEALHGSALFRLESIKLKPIRIGHVQKQFKRYFRTGFYKITKKFGQAGLFTMTLRSIFQGPCTTYILQYNKPIIVNFSCLTLEPGRKRF